MVSNFFAPIISFFNPPPPTSPDILLRNTVVSAIGQHSEALIPNDITKIILDYVGSYQPEANLQISALRTPLKNTVEATIGERSTASIPKELTNIILAYCGNDGEGYLKNDKIFGEEVWKSMRVEVPPAPSLPWNISAIWNGPCPVYSGKKIRDTHMLVYIPETVNGKPLTLQRLIKIARPIFPQRVYQGFSLGKPCDGDEGLGWDPRIEKYGIKPIDKGCWVLMTRDILPDSKMKTYEEQEKMVGAVAKKAKATYQIPQTIEAVVGFVTHYFRTKEFLFEDRPFKAKIATRCRDEIDGTTVAVGNLYPCGQRADMSKKCDFSHRWDNIGIVAVRML